MVAAVFVLVGALVVLIVFGAVSDRRARRRGSTSNRPGAIIRSERNTRQNLRAAESLKTNDDDWAWNKQGRPPKR